jgi:hypothetical protein
MAGGFDRALEWYLRGFIGPRLAPMERPGAATGDIERFFAGLAGFFPAGGQPGRGCLMINSIAEDQGRGTLLGLGPGVPGPPQRGLRQRDAARHERGLGARGM